MSYLHYFYNIYDVIKEDRSVIGKYDELLFSVKPAGGGVHLISEATAPTVNEKIINQPSGNSG